MTAINQRLARLEERADAKRGVVGRFICIIGGGSHSEAEIWVFLGSQGIEQQPGDMIIERSIWAPGEDGPEAANAPLAIRDVIETRHTHEEALGMLS